MRKVGMISLFCALIFVAACTSKPEEHQELQTQPSILPTRETMMPPTASATHTPQPSPLPTRTRMPTLSPFSILEPEDGGEVKAAFDTDQALPMVPVQVKFHTHRNSLIYLEADGRRVRLFEVGREHSGQPVKLSWTPWHGNGDYQLIAGLYDKKEGVVLGEETLTVRVTGIPEDALTVEERVKKAYNDWFDLNVPHPPFIYYSTYYRSSAEHNAWISTVYLEDRLYEIWLYDAGVPGGRGSLRLQTASQDGFCRPEGHYDLLVVVVEYSASRVDVNQVMEILSSEVEIANQRWAADAKRAGLSEPIMSIDATVIGPIPPPREGELLTPEDVQQITGVNPHGYDLLFEVDLDPYKRSMSKYHAHAGGMSFGNRCKPGGQEGVNAFMAVADSADLDFVGEGLYQHELHHLMGWSHSWPSGTELDSVIDIEKSLPLPSLLYGWRDIDGDGVVEILDPDPYGMSMEKGSTAP